MELACSRCHRIFRDIEKCPHCNIDLTRDWTGKMGIIDPEKSKTAKEVKIDIKGLFALKT